MYLFLTFVEDECVVAARGRQQVKLWQLHVRGDEDSPASCPLVTHLGAVVAV